MILTSQPLFVVVQRERQIHLVTRSTELRRFVQRLQERLLVKRRLGFHELIVDPLQNCVVTLRERIVNRFFDRVVSVADITVHVRDRMAHRARDPGLSSGMVQHVELRVVKRTTEEGNRVMTARTEAGPLNCSIAFEIYFPCFCNTCQIRGIIERTESMSTLRPVVVCVLVTFQAIVIHVQCVGVDEVACGGASQRRLKVVRAFFRSDNIPFSRILRLPPNHSQCRTSGKSSPDESLLPPHLWTDQTMHPVEPTTDQRCDHMSPIHD